MQPQPTVKAAAPPEEHLRRIDSLIAVGLRLAGAAPTGRIALARIADAIELSWVPRPWGDQIVSELQAASTAAREPLELKQVERILQRAWGVDPAEELDELYPEPVAVTPGAQVHRGALEGSPVAVKVLRPGLAASVRQDLTLLEVLLAPLGMAFPALDARATVHEIRERILEELDLEHEATRQRWFHRALRGHPFLSVPAPVTRLSHQDVLVSEWVDGVPLWQAPDPDLAAARLVRFVLGAAHAGIIHADPHPDDVLVLPDGGLAILDFGATREVDGARHALRCDALEALLAEDLDAFSARIEELGWLPAAHGVSAAELARRSLGELLGPEPALLDNEAVIAARDRLFGQAPMLVEVITAGALPPEDIWPARGVAQLFGAIARVGATGAWPELALRAMREGWSAPE